MAKLLSFTEGQFAHLSPAAKLEVKRVVYRKDFQESVISLRKKYALHDFPVIDPQKTLEKERPSGRRYRSIPRSEHGMIPDFFGFFDHEPDAQFAEDVRAAVLKHGGQDGILWLQLLYVFARFNVIPNIATDAEAVIFPPTQIAMASWQRRLKRCEKALKDGTMTVRDVLPNDHVFYSSDTISASEDGFGMVTLRFTTDAPQKTLRKVLKAVEVYQKFFKRRQLGKRDIQQLDMYNDIAEWHRLKWNESKIQQAVEEKYRRYDIVSIGQLVRRATKELGF